jgi:hypothetical protein
MAERVYEVSPGVQVYNPDSMYTMHTSLDVLVSKLRPLMPSLKGMIVTQASYDGPQQIKLLDAPATADISGSYSWSHSIGHLTVSPVPHCCGLTLGSGFQVHHGGLQALDALFEWFEEISWYDLERCQVMYISTDQQHEINKVLRARGYEQVYEFVNANSGNKIYHWFKDVQGDDLRYDDDEYDDYDDDDYEDDEE